MTNDLEQKAREVLGTVELMGVDFVRGSQAHNPHLQYGLEHELYGNSDIDGANTKFRQTKAREVLGTVELIGVDFVRGSQAHNPHLQYGLEHELYSQIDVDNAQGKYLKSKKE